MSDQWWKEVPAAITVCDERGVIVEMNDRSAATFEADGGRALIGADVRACHPAGAQEKVERLFAEREPNVYSIRKQGVRKLIYQCAWYRDGVFAGVVELSLPIPNDIPEFDRG